MDINDVRGFATLLVLIAFIGICWWAFSPKRKQRFNEAANLPFADEERHEQAQDKKSSVSTLADASSSENRKQD